MSLCLVGVPLSLIGSVLETVVLTRRGKMEWWVSLFLPLCGVEIRCYGCGPCPLNLDREQALEN